MESRYAVAAGDIGRGDRIDSGYSIVIAVPGVAVAGGGCFGADSTVVDGQVQCNGAVATDGIGR